MIYADKNLICRDCGAEFPFTAFEQEFYVLNSFGYEIECCRECRQKRKSPGRPVFLRAPQAMRSVRPMQAATCFVCGTTIDISFAPRFGKPVYCADCYELYGRQYAHP